MKTKSRYASIELRPAKAVENFDDYRGVWVIVEQRQGKVQDVTLELLGAGRPMADKRNVHLTAVLLGYQTGDMAEGLIAAGADEVIICEHPILKTPLARPSADVLTRLIKERKPEIVLIGATHTGRDISSRVAVKVDAGMTADCTELDVDDNGELLARRPAFGGKMLATIRCDRHRPQMATARPGIFKPLDVQAARKGKTEKVDVAWLSNNTYHAELLDYVVDQGVDITKAQIIVAGGIGIGGPEGFAKLQELADALGGEVAASRAACDKGWVARGRQVGQTGVSVRPKLYIAVGISGAIQHIEGMKESGTVLAINSDPNAPIFGYADIGIVSDWKPAVAGLIEQAKTRGLKDKKWMVPTKDTLEADRQAARERALKAAKAEAAAPKAEAAAPKAEAAAPKAAPAKAEPTPPAAKGAKPTEAQTKAATAPATAKAAIGAPAAPAPTNQAAQAGKPDAPAAAPTQSAAKAEGTGWPAPYSGDPTDQAAVKAYAATVPEEKKAWVLAADCIVCNGCEAACPTAAAIVTDMARVDRDLCIADGACFDACPTDAIRPGIEEKEKSGGWPDGSRLAGQFGV
jgi:electron transfer flavoprotein alpha subunit